MRSYITAVMKIYIVNVLKNRLTCQQASKSPLSKGQEQNQTFIIQYSIITHVL